MQNNTDKEEETIPQKLTNIKFTRVVAINLAFKIEKKKAIHIF